MIYTTLIPLLLLFFGALSTEHDNFKLGLRFQDDPELVRDLLIDISTSSSFVVLKGSKPGQVPKDVFDPKKSPTFLRAGRFFAWYKTDTNFHSGTCEGVLGLDWVLINSTSKSLSRFGVCEVKYGDPVRGLDRQRYAGRVGFGAANETNGVTVRSGLMKDWKEPVLCLATRKGEKVTSPGQNLANSTNTIAKVQVNSNTGYWEFNSKFSVGSIAFDSSKIVLTTTNYLLLLPKSLYHIVSKAFGGDYQNNAYFVECNSKLPTLRLEIDGKKVEIDGGEFVEVRADGRCVLLTETSRNDYILLGTQLLRMNGICLNMESKLLTFFNPN